MSSIREMVIVDYKEFIAMEGYRFHPDLISALKHNERVPGFLDRLSKELYNVDRRIRVDRKTIKEAVYSMTEFFISNVKAKAEWDAKSELDRLAAKAKATEMERMEQEMSREVEEIDRSKGLSNGRVEDL